MPCSGCDHPPRMAFPRGPFAGGRFLGFFWKRPVQVPSTGARGASIDIPSPSEGSSARVKQSPKRKRGVKQPGNTEHEKAIMQQRMRNNRPAMHQAPAPKRIAGCSLQARRQLSAWRVAPAKKHSQPPRNSTVRAHFSREITQIKVTHITNKIIKPFILILLMETPEAPKRGKSPKPCHIRTYSVIIQPKSEIKNNLQNPAQSPPRLCAP